MSTIVVNGQQREFKASPDTPLLYPILTMAEMPALKVVITNNPGVGTYGQGSESANALASPAIAAAVMDATGKPVRRLPVKPERVRAAMGILPDRKANS